MQEIEFLVLNNSNNLIADEDKIAMDLLLLARDTITVRFRFFDAALFRLNTSLRRGLGGISTDGESLFFDPQFILKAYLDEPNYAVRAYLHMLFHCIFLHQFQYDKLDEEYWNLACDIAVENVILELGFPAATMAKDAELTDKIFRLKKRVERITAEKLYREFMVNGLSKDYKEELKRLFSMDSHSNWRVRGEEKVLIIDEEEWKKISRRIKTELESFARDNQEKEGLSENLSYAIRDRYNYRELLEKFMVSREEIGVNDEEFDYIYYNYGLSTYGNMPLIEPLEYKESNKIRDLVCAIDTSASCQGSIVKEFVKRTYDIIKSTENFFHEVNIHIIQCDNMVQSDTIIKNENDLQNFINGLEISGRGGTDFRPVFTYVDELLKNGSFENLKGLIYFTDGYGVYPERMPLYDVIFAFLYEDANRDPVPDWAIKVVLEDELEGKLYEH